MERSDGAVWRRDLGRRNEKMTLTSMNTDLANRVRQFVSDFCRKNRDQLRADTRLEEDLGITGDDAAELLEAFAGAFEIDPTEIEFHKHFGPE